MDDEILYVSTGHLIGNCSAYLEHCPDSQEQMFRFPTYPYQQYPRLLVKLKKFLMWTN